LHDGRDLLKIDGMSLATASQPATVPMAALIRLQRRG
jgi:hypothetical protein